MTWFNASVIPGGVFRGIAKAGLSLTPENAVPSKRWIVATALTLGSAFAAIPPAHADEGGVGFWVPGINGSLAATPGEPGWSWVTVYYHTSVNAGADVRFPRGGDVDVGIEGRGNLVMFGPTYTFAEPWGTWLETKMGERDGKTVLVYTGKVGHLNDKEGKPVTLNLAIGKRPIFVGGNEGGRGDIAMMRWSKDRNGPSFQILINHDDAEREFVYSESDNYSLDAAKQFGFHVVSMKDDWKEIVGE